MAELVFPLAATLVLLLVAIPLATLLAKAWLMLLRSPLVQSVWPAAGGICAAGSSGRYLAFVAPVLVPAIWLVSAAVHHAEAEEAALACAFEHVYEDVCSEPLIIALAITLLLAAAFWRRRRTATRAIAALRNAHDAAASRRLTRACASHPRLVSLRRRIRVVEGDDIRTVGLFQPRVEVGADIVHRLDPEALAGALLHESQHVAALDPLRFLVASVCQSLNPAAFLLRDEFTRWRGGREAVCDQAAVHHGADPCSLAAALVAVARPPARVNINAAHSMDVAHSIDVAHLGEGGGMALLRARVALLLGYASAPPRCHCSSTLPKLAVLALVGLAALPHYWGEGAMVGLHQGAERALVDSFTTR